MYSDTKRDLQNLGDGLWAWVQGDGSWGWSNSGLITGEDGQSLVVDTLFTGKLTEDMLEAYRRADPAAAQIDILVNTHSNGDHTFGNHLVRDARIIASEAAREEMEERPATFFKAAAADPAAYGVFGEFLHNYMGRTFDFSDIEHTPPTEVFKGSKTLSVGGRKVELTELGPAHTRGDIIVYLPDSKVCYTGDLVFHGGHPIMWAGPVGNWIAACDHILGLDADIIVPGHGAITDKSAVQGLRDYFSHILAETRKCYEAGLGWEEAAFEVGYANFDSWLDRERVVANVATIYRELSGGKVNPAQEDVLRHMLRYSAGAKCPHDDACGCGKDH
jgi:glyoxylase-like metal-dependent hydrolase (beta-lactamase superfamily II)